jgi:hypothetical protein
MRIVAAFILFFSYFDFANGELIGGCANVIFAIVIGAITLEKSKNGSSV